VRDEIIKMLKQFGKEVLENQSYKGACGWYANEIMEIALKDKHNDKKVGD
jgi:hypothetical protein